MYVQVLQLRLTDVARALIEHANFDVNEMIVDGCGGQRTVLPLFQWCVDLVVQTDMALFELIFTRADVSLIVDPTTFSSGFYPLQYCMDGLLCLAHRVFWGEISYCSNLYLTYRLTAE